MRYVELITQQPLIWGLFLVYMAVTAWLAWLGQRRTKGIESFSIGNGDMSPLVVGVTLAASIASTATFVINPGFVHVHGISALVHYGLAAGSGVILGLVLLSPGFRRVGQRYRALTLPHWIGQRYGSQAMSTFFALVSLLSFTFMVLIVAGLAIVMEHTLGLTRTEAVILVIGFVFSYVFVGGAYAHAFTNTLQGIIMSVVAVIIVVSGLHLLGDGAMGRLAAQDPNLVKTVNPASMLYGSVFSVWISGFVVGFALVCQPHILTKALYVKSDSAVRRYLGVTVVVSLVFSALLLVGIYTRLAPIPAEAFLDPTTGRFAQDRVMAAWLGYAFDPTWRAFITVAILAAGMSTLDGLLVATSSIAGNDLFPRFAPRAWLSRHSPEEQSVLAQRAGQAVLVAMALGTLWMALNPPRLLGIFGQVGVYGLMAAAAAPVLFGVLADAPPRRPMFVASLLGVAVHLGLYWLATWALESHIDLNAAAAAAPVPSFLLDTDMPQLGLLNPAVTATYGIAVSLLVGGVAVVVTRGRPATSTAPAPTV